MKKLFLTVIATLMLLACASHASAQTTACVPGPPNYNCSRTDFDIVQTPAIAPFSGAVGANQIKKDPDFGTNILRCTDADTNNGGSLHESDMGAKMFNYGHNLIIVHTNGGASIIMKFTGSPMSCTRTPYKFNTVAVVWSTNNGNVLYWFDKGVVRKVTIPLDRVSPLVETTLVDFTTTPGAPSPFVVKWHGIFNISNGDRSITEAISDTGPQETGTWIFNWTAGKGKGRRLLNTATGVVTGDWGPIGTIDLPNRLTLHSAIQTPNPNYVTFGTNNCFEGCGVYFAPFLWTVPTLHVAGCSMTAKRCSGHAAEGYLAKYFWGAGTGQIKVVPYATWGDESTYTKLLPDTSIPPRVCTLNDGNNCWSNDMHGTYQGVNSTDTLPAKGLETSTAHAIGCTFPRVNGTPYQNEVLVVPNADFKYHREGHTFASGCSNIFDARYGIGSNSNDGRFIAIASDMDGQLGCQDGTDTCDINSRRSDVFIYRLR